MDDDLEPITAIPALTRGAMTLSLPAGSRQMRLTVAAYRWLREAHGLADDVPLKVNVGVNKATKFLAVVYDPKDGLVVDAGNYYASGALVRGYFGNPKERTDIPLTPNVEKKRLDGGEPVTLPSQAEGVPARRSARASHAGAEQLPSSERPNADASGPSALPASPTDTGGADASPAPPTFSKAAAMRAEVAAAAQRRQTLAPCPHAGCGAEGVQQGTLTDYTKKPPQPTAMIFACPNGHRFEIPVGGSPGDGVMRPGDSNVSINEGSLAAGGPLTPEEAADADAVVAEMLAETENDEEVNPEWLAALNAGEAE